MPRAKPPGEPPPRPNTKPQPTRPPLRRLKLALLLITLGAATNYALVWGIIRFGPVGWRQPVSVGAALASPTTYTFIAGGVPHQAAVDRTTWGIACEVLAVKQTTPIYARPPIALTTPKPWMTIPSTLQREGVSSTRTTTHACGLPFICLMRTEGALYDQTDVARIWREPFWQFTAETGTPPTTYTFPLMPVWPGFLANTAIFAAAWLLIIRYALLPFCRITARAWAWLERRIEASQRGKCIKCGYPRTGLAEPHTPCPECGSRQF